MKYNNPRESNFNIDKFDQYNISKCPKCNLMCSFNLFYQDNLPFINFKCENNHDGNILLKDYINKQNKYSSLKQKCEECGKEIKENLFFCSKCSKFICYSCSKNYLNKDIHNIFNFKKNDNLCKIHSNIYSYYCIQCGQKLCINCKSKHNSHNILNLSKFIYSKESKMKLNGVINNLENKIKNLDMIKQNIKTRINELKDSIELEIKLIKMFLDIYEFEEKQNNLNYYIIQNLKNFEKVFKSNLILYEKILNKGNEYINLLQNLHNISLNSFNKNIKTIKYHSECINYISQLKDGRLASCSNDNSFNIYKKDSYELELSIKEHSDWITSFTELNDRRIITCSGDKTMKLIKLKEENKYEIQQTLKGHIDTVYKIIEIKENELISLSSDKRMKIWMLNNDNKFDCITNIYFQNLFGNCNILKLNEKEFVISSCNDKCIKFWNSNNYSNIATINNIESSWSLTNMCLLEEDILCIGGGNSKGFYLIKISNHQFIKNIYGPKTILSIVECADGLILCSIKDDNWNNCLVKYKYENLNLTKIVEKNKAHNNTIYSCIELFDGIIASGGDDYSIKLWSN